MPNLCKAGWLFAARWAADLLAGLAEIHRLGFVNGA